MIIDNEKITMVGRFQETMPRAKNIDIAVGYFFISGFAEIMDSLKYIEDNDPDHVMRILTSPVTDRITAEALFSAYETQEEVKGRMGSRASSKSALAITARGIQSELEHMEQTSPQKNAVRRLINLIRRKKIDIRIYTKEQLHAKLYLAKLDGTDYQESIIGSSNFSISGLRTHAELNFSTTDDAHYEKFLEWFERHWNDPSSRLFTEDVARILENSWAGKEHTPRMVTGKAAITENPEILSTSSKVKLYDFQQTAADAAIKKLDDYGGVMIADVVGTGKSYTGMAVLKHLVDEEILNPLIICPARLKPMWKDLASKYDIPPNILSNSSLDDLRQYSYCDAILIDESHAFKDSRRVRYEKLAEYMGNKMTYARIIMLTATPISNTVHDLENQLALFQQDMLEKIPVLEETETNEGRSKLEAYFEGVHKDEMVTDINGKPVMTRRRSSGELRPKMTKVVTHEGREKIRELLKYVLIRRTRNSIQDHLRNKGNVDERGPYLYMDEVKQYFPERNLYNPEYSAEKTYGAAEKFAKIESLIKSMTFARYIPGNYVRKEYEDRPPYDDLLNLVSLGGIVLTSLLKLMESSIMAFDSSVKRYGEGHMWFLGQLEEDKVAVGRGFQEIIRKIMDSDGEDSETSLMNEMEKMTSKYRPEAFYMEKWISDVRHDMKQFFQITNILRGDDGSTDTKPKEKTEEELDELFIPRDDKLKQLFKLVKVKNEKILIFTESRVTARYMFRYLNNRIDRMIVQIDSRNKNQEIEDAVNRFAPKFNKGEVRSEDEIDILISTDMLSEGLNLQAGRIIINYDFHWNPVRLIQRTGRIDRLGSLHETIEVHNFLTTPLVDQKLDLRMRVRRRIGTMRDIIGVGYSRVLETTEPLDEEGVCDIYDGKEAVLDPKIGEGGMLDPPDTGSEKIAEDIRSDEKTRAQYEELPYGIRSSVGSDKLLIAYMAEDVLSVSGTEEISEFRRYYEVTEKGARRIRQSSFLSQLVRASKMQQIKEPPTYDKFVADAWEQFYTDCRNTTRRIPIRKYQKHFDKILQKINPANMIIRHRILETRRFVRSRMQQAKPPYRDLIKLYHEVKKDDLDDDLVLKRLEALSNKYGKLQYKRKIRRPHILYGMMVGN